MTLRMDTINSSVLNQPSLSSKGTVAVLLASCVEIILCLLGTLGNSLIIAAVCRNQNLQVASNLLVGSLAFADLLVSVVLVPMRASQHMAMYLGSSVPTAVVEVAGFVGRVNIIASISSLSAMSIDRYIALSHPMHYLVSIRFAKNKIFAVITVIWTVSIFVTSVPKFPGVSDQPFLIFFVVFVLLMTATIVVAYYNIFKIARKAGEAKQSNSKEESRFARLSLSAASTVDCRIDNNLTQKQERKATKTIGFVIGAFVVLVCPRILLILYHFAAEETVESKNVRSWIRILLYSNSVVNPALYAWRHKEFKREFKKILLKCWRTFTCRQSLSLKLHLSTMTRTKQRLEKQELGTSSISVITAL